MRRGPKYTVAPNDMSAERKVMLEMVEDFQGFPTIRVVLLKRGVSYNFPNIEDLFAFLRKFYVMDRDTVFTKQIKVEPEPEKPKEEGLTAKQLREIVLDMADTKQGTTAREVMEYAKITKENRQRVDQLLYSLNRSGQLWSRPSGQAGEVGKRYFHAKVHPDTVSR